MESPTTFLCVSFSHTQQEKGKISNTRFPIYILSNTLQEDHHMIMLGCPIFSSYSAVTPSSLFEMWYYQLTWGQQRKRVKVGLKLKQ